jgi:hypothetical protein
VQVPQRSIADSPCLPSQPAVPRPPTRIISFDSTRPSLVAKPPADNCTKEEQGSPISFQKKPVSFLSKTDISKGSSITFKADHQLVLRNEPANHFATSLTSATLSSPALREAAMGIHGPTSASKYFKAEPNNDFTRASKAHLVKTMEEKTRISLVAASPQLHPRAPSLMARPQGNGTSSLSMGIPSLRDKSLFRRPAETVKDDFSEKTHEIPSDNGSKETGVAVGNITQGRFSNGGPVSRLRQEGKKLEAELTTPAVVSGPMAREPVQLTGAEVQVQQRDNAQSRLNNAIVTPTASSGSGKETNSLRVGQEVTSQYQPVDRLSSKAASNKTVIYIRKDKTSSGSVSNVSGALGSDGASISSGKLQQPSGTNTSVSTTTSPSQRNQKSVLQRPSQTARNDKTPSVESFLDQNDNESRLEPQKLDTAFYLYESGDGSHTQRFRSSSSRSPSPLAVSKSNPVDLSDTQLDRKAGLAVAPSSSLLGQHESPQALSWADKSVLLLGPARKSSGLRMWQGGQQVAGIRRSGQPSRQPIPGAATSRSPSPSSMKDQTATSSGPVVKQPVPAAGIGFSHATLPRTSSSTMSRLRGPAAAATAATSLPQNPPQRRSYGGGVTSLLPPAAHPLASGRHASAPSTPRQSNGDPRAISPARSSSPAVVIGLTGVDSRRRSAHYPLQRAEAAQYDEPVKSSPTRAVSERSLHHSQAAVPSSSSLRYISGSHQSLLPSQAGGGGKGLIQPRGAGVPKPAQLSSHKQLPQQQQQQQQQQHPTVQSSRSRLPASHRGGFGFNQK